MFRVVIANEPAPVALRRYADAYVAWFARLRRLAGGIGADLLLAVTSVVLAVVVQLTLPDAARPWALRGTLGLLMPLVAWHGRGWVAAVAAVDIEMVARALGTADGLTPPLLTDSAISVTAMLVVGIWSRRRRGQWDREHALGRRDPLTRVGNRQALYEHLQAEFSRSARFQRPFAVALLDCDGFKSLNDHLGHLIGDLVLQRVAGVLREQTRPYDTVARWGGDEFVVLLSETGPAEAEQIIERLRTGLRHALEREYPTLAMSIGVAVFATVPLSVEDCLHRADAAMYAAKRQGRGQTVFDVVENPASWSRQPTSTTST